MKLKLQKAEAGDRPRLRTENSELRSKIQKLEKLVESLEIDRSRLRGLITGARAALGNPAVRVAERMEGDVGGNYAITSKPEHAYTLSGAQLNLFLIKDHAMQKGR